MTITRFRLYVSLLMLGTGVVAGPRWRLHAEKASTPAQMPVQMVDAQAGRPRVDSADRGSTYHALERQAARVTTRFADATVVAERTADGTFSARVTDRTGNDQATLRLRHVDATSDVMSFALGDRPVVDAARRRGLRPTLDWSGQQAYSLWKDRGALGSAALEWQDALVRPRGAPPRPADWNIVDVHTEWAGGLSAVASRRRGPQTNVRTGKKTASEVIVSHFYRDHVEVGVSYWYVALRLFAWSFPGLTEGYIDPARIALVGGWPIDPDLAWINTQNLAFYQFGTMLKARGTLSEHQGGWLNRIVEAVAPTLRANDVGCDDLHWLDGSVFRYCCDSHDLCYQRQDPACSAYSWWMWWTSWQCDVCNVSVVFCFSAAGRIFFPFG